MSAHVDIPPVNDLRTELLKISLESLTRDGNSSSLAQRARIVCSDPETRQNIDRAAKELEASDVPVAFPTETVYGLGADATRSAAVRNIFAAKGRPADNPLIVHVHSIAQLGSLLQPDKDEGSKNDGREKSDGEAILPPIYRPLIKRFWPGPLTIILRNPEGSHLAKEVTAGLTTFGARMPSHPVALALLQTSDRPLAAPSANASTKPSPTTAAHVLHDLNGRINFILDGGPCGVGVESTVVDGLSDPPTVLRPGGVSLEMLKNVEGWQNVVVGYQDAAGGKDDKPKAPGMKYKHYTPKASVILFEAGLSPPTLEEIEARCTKSGNIGVIRTASWPGLHTSGRIIPVEDAALATSSNGAASSAGEEIHATLYQIQQTDDSTLRTIWDIELGKKADHVAKGLFAALRLLDLKNVDAIFVEGIDDTTGDAAAAVMNRLRKAAEIKT